jgi:hypothetical protein
MKMKLSILIMFVFLGCQPYKQISNEMEKNGANHSSVKSGWEFEKCSENIVCLKEHGWEIKHITLEVAKNNLLKPSYHPSFIKEAQEFLNSYAPDAEIYFFKSPKFTWDALAGREGYLILKNKTVISRISTKRS